LKKPTASELFLDHHQEKLGVTCYGDDPLENAIELLNHYETLTNECADRMGLYLTDLLEPDQPPQHQEQPLEISIRKHAKLLRVRPNGVTTEIQAIHLLNLYRDLWLSYRRILRLEMKRMIYTSSGKTYLQKSLTWQLAKRSLDRDAALRDKHGN
jgi:hypothetical protein